MSNVVPLNSPQAAPQPLVATRVMDQFILAAAKDRVAIDAANSLMAEGYHVTSIQTETRFLPVVWLAFDLRLAGLVARDEACYYMSGHDAHGPFRVGQALRLGCQIQWRERPGTVSWSH